MVNNRASIITINTLINHRMTSLQENTHRTLAVRQMLDDSSMMFPETAHFSGRVVHPVFNRHDGKTGGWRWHKWGPYLGKHTPKCEYLDEEKNIDYVLLWHLYPLKKKEN